MRETRVNLRHLLEDIRDSYNVPIEEAIVTELIANALDSGADSISFSVNPLENSLTVLDNGKGMLKREMTGYHDIAATTKIRGKGIGFAGVGAKLSLLISKSVITETKGRYKTISATQWHLAKTNRAPWQFISPTGRISGRGTAVVINLTDSKSPLLSEEFLNNTIAHYFYPLLDKRFFEIILRFLYKTPIQFFINGKELFLPRSFAALPVKVFKVFAGRSRQAVGFGYLMKDINPFAHAGLAISTYGKIIKSGWEWIGITPKDGSTIFGIVEIPALAAILTINKTDFLRDANSLKKYYYYRKAIQEAILPIITEFSGEPGIEEKQKKLFPLTREIERTLGFLIGDFPELSSLLGIKAVKEFPAELLKKLGKQELTVEFAPAALDAVEEAEKQNGLFKKSEEEERRYQEKKKKPKKGPALIIAFEDGTDKKVLARMVKNAVWINKKHPAYIKAQSEGFDKYHVVLCVVWTLSRYLGEQKAPQDFVSNFLALWGEGKKKF